MNVEASLIEWLNANTDFEWFGNVPLDRPEVFGTVERTGGGISDVVVDSPTVALQVWAPTRSAASEKAYEVARAIPGYARAKDVRSVSVNSIYNFPDLQGDLARYQLVLDITTVQRAQ